MLSAYALAFDQAVLLQMQFSNSSARLVAELHLQQHSSGQIAVY